MSHNINVYLIQYVIICLLRRNAILPLLGGGGIVCDSMGQDAGEILKKLSEIDSGYMVCRATYWVRKLGIYVERIREVKFIEGLKFVSFQHFN